MEGQTIKQMLRAERIRANARWKAAQQNIGAPGAKRELILAALDRQRNR